MPMHVSPGISRETGTSADITADNEVLIDHWNAGGLVTISFHANNPWTGGESWDLTGRDLVELVTPGTAANRVWMAELDKVAAGLAELRDAGVVVLWRPFHEMTFTETVWWDSGAHPGDPGPFIDLWQHMFGYFTYVKGLDNLLWVYSVANNEHENPVLAAMYPGQAYVDLVGVDVYDDAVEIRGDGYDRLVALGKPFALTEFGPRNKRDGSYDNLTTVKTIRDRYPATTYVLQMEQLATKQGGHRGQPQCLGLYEEPLDHHPGRAGLAVKSYGYHVDC